MQANTILQISCLWFFPDPNNGTQKPRARKGNSPGMIIIGIVILWQYFIGVKWIEAVLGEKLPEGDFADVLQNGVILCRLMNKIQPESVKKIKEKVELGH